MYTYMQALAPCDSVLLPFQNVFIHHNVLPLTKNVLNFVCMYVCVCVCRNKEGSPRRADSPA